MRTEPLVPYTSMYMYPVHSVHEDWSMAVLPSSNWKTPNPLSSRGDMGQWIVLTEPKHSLASPRSQRAISNRWAPLSKNVPPPAMSASYSHGVVGYGPPLPIQPRRKSTSPIAPSSSS